MADVVRVVVDAMGGDHAPEEIVKGAIDAVHADARIHVIFTGNEEPLARELAKYTYPEGRVETVYTTERIEMAESPVRAIRTKKDSSMVVGMRLIKDGKADAFVTAGSTGAALAGGQLLVGRIKGVERPALAPILPTKDGVVLLIDCGANVDARPSHLKQFALMGSIYMRDVIGIADPRVSILNVGAEEEKGNKLVKETYPLLKGCEGIRFTGSVEACDIPAGATDVVVCEAFAGNIVLKLYEGMADTLIGKIKEGLKSTVRSKIGAALAMPALKSTLKSFDTSNYGGAPLLGLNGLVVKTHGSSKANDVKNSVLQCAAFAEQDITGKIRQAIRAADAEDS